MGDRYFLGGSSVLGSQAEGHEEEEEVEGGDEEEHVGRRVLTTLATIPKAEGPPSTIQHKNHCVQR